MRLPSGAVQMKDFPLVPEVERTVKAWALAGGLASWATGTWDWRGAVALRMAAAGMSSKEESMRDARLRLGAQWERLAASLSRFMGTPVWNFLCKVRMIRRPTGGNRIDCLGKRLFAIAG